MRKTDMIDGNIQKYLSFVKAVELGSFSDAAEAMNYSQSGISRMIADLEKDWDIVLLERDRNGIRLTSDGMRLLPYARRLCEEYHIMQEQVDDINGIQQGLIRIGTFSSVATHWLPRVIKRFQQDYPGIDYEMLLGDYSEIEEWIAEGRVDCGFLRLPTRPEFETVMLEKDELMAVIPKDHPMAGRKTFPVKELEKEPFMLLEKGGKAEISEIFEKNGLDPHVKFTTWDDYAVMSMVEQGLGISILPALILQRIPYEILVKPLDKSAFRQIGFAVKSQKTSSAAVKKFIQYIDYR
jgi:DNA-binding transcriptional LysR family regulator